MRILVKDLTLLQLNWAVATVCDKHVTTGDVAWGNYTPSSNWSQGGPILERWKLDSFWNGTSERWSVAGWDERAKREVIEWGDTLLEASMRCLVSMRHGDEVEIPGELL